MHLTTYVLQVVFYDPQQEDLSETQLEPRCLVRSAEMVHFSTTDVLKNRAAWELLKLSSRWR